MVSTLTIAVDNAITSAIWIGTGAFPEATIKIELGNGLAIHEEKIRN